MIFWLLVALMTALALAFLLVPLIRPARPIQPRRDYDLAVYRDQLRELENDLARGVLGASEAAAARLEIQRRMLALARDGSAAELIPIAPEPPWRGRRLWLVGGLGAAVPALALVLYLSLGSPSLPGHPFVAPAESPERKTIEAAVNGLAARLAREPDNLKGWLLLGRSYLTLNRHEEAVNALRRAATLGGDDPEVNAALGEALVLKDDSIVSPEAEALFENVRARQPTERAALYYLGLASAQAGDLQKALALWQELLNVAPTDAPWRTSLLAMMGEAARQLGVALKLPPAPSPPSAAAAQAPAARPGPDAEDLAAAATRSPENQRAMIRTMVERLASRLKESPNDLEGWRRLGQSYRVLGEHAKAADAFKQASALAPDDVALTLDYVRSLIDGADGSAGVPPEAEQALTRVLAREPDNRDALWIIGLVESVGKHKDDARAHWQKLLTLLAPGSEDYQTVERALKAL